MKSGNQSKMGIRFSQDLSFDEYVARGEEILHEYKRSRWLLADWLIFGEKKYGEMYAQAEEMTGLSYSWLSKLKYAAETFRIPARRRELHMQHHLEVCAIQNPHVRNRILDKAVEHKWTVKQIREHVSRIRKAMKLAGDEDEMPAYKANTYKERIRYAGTIEDVRIEIFGKIEKILANAPDDVLLFVDLDIEQMEYRDQPAKTN